MQNRYLADVGDYGKYGLLRALCGVFPPAMPQFSLGVVWYLVSSEEATRDGKHDGYLNLKSERRKERIAATYRICDVGLYDVLKRTRQSTKLSVCNVSMSSLFPSDTCFFEEPIGYDNLPWIGPKPKARREEHRRSWLERALSATKDCEIVFVDPDNGLEVTSTQIHESKARKYVYFRELQAFFDRSQSLVIYHHLGMHDRHQTQVKDRALQVVKRLGLVRKVIRL